MNTTNPTRPEGAGGAAAQEITDWFTELREDEAFSVERIHLSDSRDWHYRDAAIRHRADRFFSIVGAEYVSNGRVRTQPFIEQREVGTLGVVIRYRFGVPEVLVQAKAEPGNVELFQLAPTIQATHSNVDRVHGGKPPPMSELLGVAHSTLRVLADTLQSEQGTRFLGKRNRNCFFEQSAEIATDRYYRWLRASDLLNLVSRDHTVNTDLRSALICGDWNALAGDMPFSGDGFARECRLSLEADDAKAWIAETDLHQRMAQASARAGRTVIVDLAPVIDVASGAIAASREEGATLFDIVHIRVHSASREVTDWDQPIIDSRGAGEVTLPVARHQDCLHFLFEVVVEPGAEGRAELTPAICIAPGEARAAPRWLAAGIDRAIPLSSVRQSEEGGRFFRDENQYQLVDAGDAFTVPEEYVWLSLAQIKRCLERGSMLTNEARSALSLLLRWL